MQENRSSLPVLALLLNAFIWGIAWLPLRQLQQYGLHPLWSTTLIYTFSFSCALLILGWTTLQRLFQQPSLIGLGLVAGITNVCFNWGVTSGDVVRVVLLFYVMPVWSVLLAWWLLKERPPLSALFRMSLGLLGVLIVLKTPDSDWPIPNSLPDWLGLLAGFAFALTNVLLRHLRHVGTGLRVLSMFGGVLLMSGSMAILGALGFLVDASSSVSSIPWPSLSHWSSFGWMIGLSIAFLIGNLALQYGASHLRSHTAALVMLSEVLFASLSSVLLDAATMTPQIWMGGSMIVATAVWSALAPKE